MKYLSPIVEQVSEHYFGEESDWARDELQKFCEYLSDYISDKTTPESYERFCLAALKVGKTSKQKFIQAIELGKWDYRDLLVAAGFGNSVTIHNEWAKKFSGTNT
jgi:hypothetical protein